MSETMKRQSMAVGLVAFGILAATIQPAARGAILFMTLPFAAYVWSTTR